MHAANEKSMDGDLKILLISQKESSMLLACLDG